MRTSYKPEQLVEALEKARDILLEPGVWVEGSWGEIKVKPGEELPPDYPGIEPETFPTDHLDHYMMADEETYKVPINLHALRTEAQKGNPRMCNVCAVGALGWAIPYPKKKKNGKIDDSLFQDAKQLLDIAAGAVNKELHPLGYVEEEAGEEDSIIELNDGEGKDPTLRAYGIAIENAKAKVVEAHGA